MKISMAKRKFCSVNPALYTQYMDWFAFIGSIYFSQPTPDNPDEIHVHILFAAIIQPQAHCLHSHNWDNNESFLKTAC